MLVRMSLMKDKDLYKRDWDTEGLVNFIGKHELCRLRGRAIAPASWSPERASFSECVRPFLDDVKNQLCRLKGRSLWFY